MGSQEAAVVRAWHAALNAGDVERLVTLSSDEIEVGGPRGSSRGAQVLREWAGRAGIRLEPGRIFQRGKTLVVEQKAEWRAAGTSEATGQQLAATVFVVDGGQVTSAIRHADLESALDAAGLTAADRMNPGSCL